MFSPITIGTCSIGPRQIPPAGCLRSALFTIKSSIFKLQSFGSSRYQWSSLLCEWASLPPFGDRSAVLHGSYGQIAGVVFAGLDLAWLSDHLKERGLLPTASILIADREGNIIARLPHPDALVGKNMRESHER